MGPSRPVPLDTSTPTPVTDFIWPRIDVQMENGRQGGGHTIPLGRAAPAARGLARAAMRLDGPAQRDILEMTVDNLGVVERLGTGDHAGAGRYR